MSVFARVRWLAAVLFGAGAALLPLLAAADGAWIDAPGPNWNTPGMAIPAAPTGDGNADPRCPAVAGRWVENGEDQALVAAGWQLYGGYTAGWGVKVVKALSSYDGMCRPLGYQEFVFVDGTFAGTISQTPMDSRTDGSGDVIALGPDRVTAQFNRYTPQDPLCCPSHESIVQYTIERGGPQPVLARQAPQNGQ
jgi:hypothetical protein